MRNRQALTLHFTDVFLMLAPLLSFIVIHIPHISILSDEWAVYNNRAATFQYSDGPPQSSGIDLVIPASILLEVLGFKPPSTANAIWFHFRSIQSI